jgi:hypothetical protein
MHPRPQHKPVVVEYQPKIKLNLNPKYSARSNRSKNKSEIKGFDKFMDRMHKSF